MMKNRIEDKVKEILKGLEKVTSILIQIKRGNTKLMRDFPLILFELRKYGIRCESKLMDDKVELIVNKQY